MSAGRVPNKWGFNSFATESGAVSVVSDWQREGPWYIWRLADGTYDFTAVPDPDLPGYPAELVRTIARPKREPTSRTQPDRNVDVELFVTGRPDGTTASDVAAALRITHQAASAHLIRLAGKGRIRRIAWGFYGTRKERR